MHIYHMIVAIVVLPSHVFYQLQTGEYVTWMHGKGRSH